MIVEGLRRWAWSIGVGAIALAVYVRTMFPGLAAIGDTPKFQFVGAVLGTPHSPGYPLYMLLSWVFAQLPVGSVAYRINLMSAVRCGCGDASLRSAPAAGLPRMAMLAEHTHGSRDILLIPPAPAAVRAYKEAGYRIFAFHEHRMDLEAAGVHFVDAHLPLPTARSLTHILDTEYLTMGYPVGELSGVGAPPNHVLDPPPFNAAIRAHRW